MIRTGITGIDEMLGSGIPRGSKVMYCMEPGVDGRLFLQSTLFQALISGKRCLILTPTSSADIYLSEIKDVFGPGIDEFTKNIFILDSAARESINKENHRALSRMSEWKKRIYGICCNESIDIVFLYLDLLYEDLGLDRGMEIIDFAGEGITPTIIVEHLNLEGDSLLFRFAHEFGFDIIISLKSGFVTIPFFNFFTIEHISWSDIPRRSIPYIIKDGSIRLYIPKIIVTGPHSSGKSTFVNNASDHGISVDRGDLSGFSTTVAMDLGWLHMKGFDITLYGTPGQPRFDPIIPQLLKHAMGVVLIIDLSKPEKIERVKQILGLVSKNTLPVVIVGNKKDLPHTIDEAYLRSALDLKKEIPVFFISALKKSEVCYVIESMIEQITRFTY